VTSRTPARLAQGDAAVLSPEEAVELLPWRDESARAWLQTQGLVHEVMLPDGGSGRYVLWDEVLKALRVHALVQPAPRGKVVGLKRRTV
jgi:hypothetical protein